MILAAWGAFCYNMGHRRAYRVVLKGLLKGQIEFLSHRIEFMNENREKLTSEDITKAYFSYETVGQLVIGWYKYFQIVRDDEELLILKARIKELLGNYLSIIEAVNSKKDL